jgi:hypothetical protein
MTRDPFERMKHENPVPPGTEPGAPMSMADRIVGGRAGWPAWMVGVAAAASVLVIGLASVLVLDLGGGDDVVAGGDSTTTSLDGSTSSVTDATTTIPDDTATTVTSTTLAPDISDEVVVYLLVDDPTATGPTPSLIPVARPVSVLSQSPIDPHRAALQFLFAGPTPSELESTPMISTAVPDDARLLDVSVVDRVATVDVSAEFAAGSGSFSEIARIEQLLYTMTRFEDVDGLRLEIDGVPVEVFGGHGIVLDDPVTRSALDTALPAILIESPAHGARRFGYQPASGGWLFASGTANVFEATVSLALADADGLILWEGFTTASCGTGCRGEWEVTIPYTVDEPQMGALIAWEESARDGSQINVREHPVWLAPRATITGDTCSGFLVEDDLVEQPGLPEAVASTRSALFEAAVQCDWEALRALAGDDLEFTFGAVTDDAVTTWQELEAAGDAEPMRYLAELLNRSHGTQPGPEDQLYYAWPSAFVVPWSQVSDEQREELRPLFGDEDFAVFEDFGGYIGDRVGILSDGTWAYFVAGD